MATPDEKNRAESRVTETENGFRLTMVSGPAGKYRIAQHDDYADLKRKDFPWNPPVSLELKARVSHPQSAGTWGFGFWNDPFSFGKGPGNRAPMLPILPNAAWFFYASPPNYLSLRDDRPAQGFLAATFRSPLIPPQILLLGLPAAPFLLLRPAARLLRRLARLFVKESGVQVPVQGLTAWHDYRLELLPNRVRFKVDGSLIAETTVVPRGRLGFVLWVDNQCAAFDPTGRVMWKMLETPEPVNLEVEGIEIRELENRD